MEIKKWKMNFMEYRDLECTIPCSMYSVLLENKLIDDPFYGENEQEAEKLSENDVEFYTCIDVTCEQLNCEHVILKFYGIDTLSDIYINGRFLGKTENMHLMYTFDVKEYLTDGKNTISIKISSPIRYVKDIYRRHRLWSSEESTEGIFYIRKAYYMFGWDWGPKLPDMGIFRNVELECYDGIRLENFIVIQNHCKNSVELDIEIETTGAADGYTYEIEADGRTIRSELPRLNFVINDPKLWWPNGYGEQNLYDITVRLFHGGEIADTMTKTIGLRTLDVSTEDDKYGREFCFVVNGVKIFAMGADYIPEDNILPRCSYDRTDRLLRECVDANFNSIRVWGGGYYPDDGFYDLCDRYGLIVWQDFCVACANIWLTKEFEENITKEAIYNVKRLRHHASLGLLCGNNEMETCVRDWGKDDSLLVKMDYLRLYEYILPELCRQYAPQTFYWPSSPSSGGGFDDPNNENIGDVHFWDVWNDGMPFEEYRKYYFRFCSEFGFQSLPSMKTIKSFAASDQLNLFSPVMENHQKHMNGNKKFLMYSADRYLYSTSMRSVVYASQLVQADAIRYGVEHFRANRGRCMGAVYWQLNDCWPVASWSSIDCFGRRKALYYAAKKFFAPVLLSLHEDGYNVRLNISNETMNDFSGTVVCEIKDTGFKTLFKTAVKADTDALSAHFIAEYDFAGKIKNARENFLVCTLYDNNGRRLMEQTLIFVKPKRFDFKKPVFDVKITKNGDDTEITIKSNTYAANVEIDFSEFDIALSDNYFDITSDEGMTVYTKTEKSVAELEKALELHSVYDIR